MTCEPQTFLNFGLVSVCMSDLLYMEKNCQKIEKPDCETSQRSKRIQEDCDQLKMSENTIAALKRR